MVSRVRAEFADIFASTIVGVPVRSQASGLMFRGWPSSLPGEYHLIGQPLDIAINNNGFFGWNRLPAPSYSRNGQFKLDRSGFIVDNNGSYLTGYGVTQVADPHWRDDRCG